MLAMCYKQEVERRGRTFLNDEPTKQHLAKVAGWLTGKSTRPGLFLYGEPGNGKTTMALAVGTLIGLLYGSESYDKRKYVRYISALSLADLAKRDSQEFTAFKTLEMLHIDDVGNEPSTVKVWGNEVSPLTEVLYSRYDRQLFTIITSNLYDDDIVTRYGIRIADRFREMFDMLSFDNHSYR